MVASKKGNEQKTKKPIRKANQNEKQEKFIKKDFLTTSLETALQTPERRVRRRRLRRRERRSRRRRANEMVSC